MAPHSVNISVETRLDLDALGSEGSPVEIRLPPGCVYSVTVRNSAGHPVVGASVEPIDLGFRPEQIDTRDLRTDSSGLFEARHLGVGKYIWMVNANGFKPQGREIEFAAAGQVIREDVTLTPCPRSVELHVRCHDGAGAPIHDVTASLDVVTSTGERGELESTGGATIEEPRTAGAAPEAVGTLDGSNLSEPGARYFLFVKRRGFATHVEEVPRSELLDKERWTREVTLAPARIVVGHVIPSKEYNPGGLPDAEWAGTISLERIAGKDEYPWKDNFTARPGGDFQIDWLPDGDYLITEEVTGFSATLHVPHDTPITIDLDHHMMR